MNYSVLMSVYEKENPIGLRKSVDSMLTQSVPPSQLVIVEDGPLTQELYDVLDYFDKKHPTLIDRVVLETNKGLGIALREGLKYCKYNYVARMDTDDIAYPNRCELQLKVFVKDSKLGIVGGLIEEFSDNIENVSGIRWVPEKDKEIRNYMRKRCPFNHMTVMFKKDMVLSAGSYKDYFWNEDYYLWIRMSLLDNILFYNIQKPLVRVDAGPEMYKRRGGWKYFKSEYGLQKLMLNKKIINLPRFLFNVSTRLFVQILMPNSIRAFIFKKFAREAV